jgi:isoleucyl-tRNA synthetase
VLLNDFPKVMRAGIQAQGVAGAQGAADTPWPRAWDLRAHVTRALEEKRKAGEIGQSLEAKVRLSVAPADATLLDSFGAENLAAIFIVSAVDVVADATATEPKVEVTVHPDAKCTRCWRWLPSVGTHPDHPELCDRCHGVVSGLP